MLTAVSTIDSVYGNSVKIYCTFKTGLVYDRRIKVTAVFTNDLVYGSLVQVYFTFTMCLENDNLIKALCKAHNRFSNMEAY